jgi:hypothetical protein
MSSGYVSNVPLSNQSLGITQPIINTNFTVLNTNMGVDHVDFTNPPPVSMGNGGRHNQVSLVQQSGNPTAMASGNILFTKLSGGATELFMERATGDASTVIQLTYKPGNPSAGSFGISFLPGGLIIQWGVVTSPADNNQILFGAPGNRTPFPNNCFNVQISPGKSGSIDDVFLTLKSLPSTSASGFTPRIDGGSLDFLTYLAIGN